MTLRGSEPIKENLRLKAFIYGPAGVGKTLAALQFPNAYIIDTAKETTRYTNLIKQKNSNVFYCSDPFEVLKELYELASAKHNFQTIIIDEITTLYQNLQSIWTDKFVEAAEADKSKNSKQVLLQDFGFRYWDKVKRDWRRIIDALRNLDMNVIVNAHQKDKYGLNQSVVGITSDSEKNDEYIFDFVFRLIIRGQEYKAITEKQRVLPVEIDPEAKQFPKEFSWNYDTILKFYNIEYLEKNACSSKEEITNDVEQIKQKNKAKTKKTEVKENNIENIQQTNETINIESNNNISNEKEDDITKIKILLKSNNIKASELKNFLRNQCKWNHVNKLSDLSDKEKNTIITRWNSLYEKYCLYINNTKNNTENISTNIDTNKNDDCNKTALLNIIENEQIREDQKQVLMNKLEEKGITIQRLLTGFGISNINDITQGGAANMIENFDMFIQAF